LGSRGYNSMRVSMISQQSSLHSVAHGSAWDYEDQFQNCGQNNGQNYHLGTKLVEVDPGSQSTVDVGGTQIQINIPKQGEGSVGLYVADALRDAIEFMLATAGRMELVANQSNAA